MSLTTRLLMAGAGAIAACAILAMLSSVQGAQGLVLKQGMPAFGDFLAFWSAGKMALEGHAAQIYDFGKLAAAQNADIPGITKHFPWHSPPPLLLIMAPLGALPYWAAALVFFFANLALYVFGIRTLSGAPRSPYFALTTPVALLQAGSVQLVGLVAGFTALAFHWLNKRPVAAGAAIAALAIKPHLAVLWPVLLIAQGRWRTFMAAAAFVLTAFLAAGAIFGFDLYARFIADLSAAQAMVNHRVLPRNTLASLYANLIYMGAPRDIAAVLHGLSAAGAIIVSGIVFRRNDLRSSALALSTGVLLISPYLFFYDTLVLAAGAAALAAKPLKPIEIALIASFFLAGGLCLALGFVATPPLIAAIAWAGLVYALMELRETASARPA